MSDPNISLTNDTGEQKIRMAKVRVSGRFRTWFHAEARYQSSSYLASMAALGYSPLVAIRIALAADMIKMHNAKPASADG